MTRRPGNDTLCSPATRLTSQSYKMPTAACRLQVWRLVARWSVEKIKYNDQRLLPTPPALLPTPAPAPAPVAGSVSINDRLDHRGQQRLPGRDLYGDPHRRQCSLRRQFRDRGRHRYHGRRRLRRQERQRALRCRASTPRPSRSSSTATPRSRATRPSTSTSPARPTAPRSRTPRAPATSSMTTLLRSPARSRSTMSRSRKAITAPRSRPSP